jgi:hypothetical protein
MIKPGGIMREEVAHGAVLERNWFDNWQGRCDCGWVDTQHRTRGVARRSLEHHLAEARGR